MTVTVTMTVTKMDTKSQNVLNTRRKGRREKKGTSDIVEESIAFNSINDDMHSDIEILTLEKRSYFGIKRNWQYRGIYNHQ
uniref:Uncharacterized protein n=1 Tax=Megaselia scalaris TaxID=36166 RepID=T1GFH2_MEGSC